MSARSKTIVWRTRASNTSCSQVFRRILVVLWRVSRRRSRPLQVDHLGARLATCAALIVMHAENVCELNRPVARRPGKDEQKGNMVDIYFFYRFPIVEQSCQSVVSLTQSSPCCATTYIHQLKASSTRVDESSRLHDQLSCLFYMNLKLG